MTVRLLLPSKDTVSSQIESSRLLRFPLALRVVSWPERPAGSSCPSPSASGEGELRSAGSKPDKRPQITATDRAKPKTIPPYWTSSRRGMRPGANVIRSRIPHRAKSRPSKPPAKASTRASVSRWTKRRPRLAPDHPAAALDMLPNAHRPVGFDVRQGPEKYTEEYAEHRRNPADAQGERENRGDGEAGSAAQTAHRDPHVVGQDPEHPAMPARRVTG